MAKFIGRMLLVGMTTLAGVSTGCRTISRGITETVLEQEQADVWQVQYGSRVGYTLTNDTLYEVEFEGSKNAGDTVVRYQRGLGPQAQCIADKTTELLEQVQERTGVTISTRSTIYLLRFDRRPENLDITLSVEPNEFPLPLFIQAGDESCEAILAQNHSYPYLLVHELVETSLATRAGGQVLPDLSWGILGLNFHVNNYTRWFRDGLANYAGFVAHETLAEGIPAELRLHHRQALVHTHPFSALAQIGDRLFSWPQSSHTAYERDYYSAALGLFLLIADTFGEQAIRDMVGEIACEETVDGRDLVQIAGRVLRTDVKRLAEDFEFPHLGLELERMSPALARNTGVELHGGLYVKAVTDDSLAQRAGLREKDVITAVGLTPVANELDFELGLFRTRKAMTVPLTVHRAGAGTLTLELSFAESKPPRRTGRATNSENP